MNAAEIRFLCPHCRQKLACEDGYTGWQIQCPACQGPVIVPLAIPPLPTPVTRAPPAAALTSAEQWRRLGILGVAALFFGLLSAPIAVHCFREQWGTSFQVMSQPSLVFVALGMIAFVGGAACYWDSTRSVAWPLLGGCLALGFPLLLVGMGKPVAGFLGAGCSVMLGKGDQGLEWFAQSFFSFLILSVVLSVWVGLFNALRSR